jgi:glycosylphosphatidylinositol transamidase (GPIT) subunit GPI8
MTYSKRIKHDGKSKMMFYASGHGGNTYMKMQDTHVVYNYDIGIMIKELALKKM